MSDDDRYHNVLDEVGKVFGTLREFEARVAGEIAEYKKTVNNAISLLAKEVLDISATVKQRFDEERDERMARQRRTDYKDYAMLIGMGCLIVVGVILIIAVLFFLYLIAGRAAMVRDALLTTVLR